MVQDPKAIPRTGIAWMYHTDGNWQSTLRKLVTPKVKAKAVVKAYGEALLEWTR